MHGKLSRDTGVAHSSSSNSFSSFIQYNWCTSGCVVECRICNWEVAGSKWPLKRRERERESERERDVAGSNLGCGYFGPRSTQPSIPPGLVSEYQLQLGRQRQV